jgi:hypothetical protein
MEEKRKTEPASATAEAGPPYFISFGSDYLNSE